MEEKVYRSEGANKRKISEYCVRIEDEDERQRTKRNAPSPGVASLWVSDHLDLIQHRHVVVLTQAAHFHLETMAQAQERGSIVNLRRTKAPKKKAIIRQLAYRSTGVVGEGNKPLLLAGEQRAVDALLIECIIDLWRRKGGKTGDIDIMEMEGKMKKREEILTSRANKRRGPRYRPPPLAGSAIFRR
jgi:hypothetical protein